MTISPMTTYLFSGAEDSPYLWRYCRYSGVPTYNFFVRADNREHMPTGLAKRLLDACKSEADAKPKLYRATVTEVSVTQSRWHR